MLPQKHLGHRFQCIENTAQRFAACVRDWDGASRNRVGILDGMTPDPFLAAAIAQARKSLNEGGIPIGAVLVHQGRIIGEGHNCRVQTGSPIDHGEMNCLRNAGRLPASVYRECTMYTTLSPCPMCSGAILLYKIPRVVVGENRTFMGAENTLRGEGVLVEVIQDEECVAIMNRFINQHPELWHEDIAV
jgi:creatinine deaminase